MKKIIFATFFLLFLPVSFLFADDARNFFVEENFDLKGRERLGAILVEETDNLKFYFEENWIEELDGKEDYLKVVDHLDQEFESTIKKEMTSEFGPPPIHPVEEDERISILFHSMHENAGGYFNSGDQHSRHQIPRSNEKNLLYLNTDVLDRDDVAGFLAHEFMHSLVFNQKERMRGVREEIWLNEARAEFMPTWLGYDNSDTGILSRRKDTFLRAPNTSLTEWNEKKEDYGVVNIFTQYLVDHYGIEILSVSLKSQKTGIESINYALEEIGHEKDFHQVFNNFKIASLVNDCELGERYCFKNENLREMRIYPVINYVSDEAKSLSVESKTKNWTGNWHKITGINRDLELIFSLDEDVEAKVPYLLEIDTGELEIGYMEIENGKGIFNTEERENNYQSITIMPSIQEKTEGFNGNGESFYFKWEIESLDEDPEELRREEKLNKLKELMDLLREIRERREEKDRSEWENCVIDMPLYKGVSDKRSVTCLQTFLSRKPEIYPEGKITGNFGQSTEKAVIRFQEKYSEEILTPLNLEKGTGYVGEATVSKINDLR